MGIGIIMQLLFGDYSPIGQGGEANAENFWVYLEMELKKCRLAILEANLKEPPVRKQGK